MKLLYPKKQHTTCLAHLLHNVLQRIRATYPAVDELIADVKGATVKNRARRNQFLEEHLPSPPQPVITRWGTWLEAAKDYP